jgi:LDH2 family malate/lactate/ureidoglycolate dehydrogenase
MPDFEADVLERVATDILVASGAADGRAREVARSLVLSNRMGHDSHGIMLLAYYMQLKNDGQLNLSGEWSIVKESEATALIDGNWVSGQIVAREAMGVAIDKSRQVGTASVGVYNLSHIGRVGEYTEWAASQGFVAIATFAGNAEKGNGVVAPYGGAKGLWSTNPIALAIPRPGVPFSFDFATSAIARGKASLAQKKGEQIPENTGLDKDGFPTRDPEKVLDGGALLPFGGHKGYGLSFAIEILAGFLIGAASPDAPEGDSAPGMFIIVIDPDRFRTPASFQNALDGLYEYVRSCPPAEGFQEVLVPGDPEHRRLMSSDSSTISIPDEVQADMDQIGHNLGIELIWE